MPMLLCLCLSLCCFHLLLYLCGSVCQLRGWELNLGSKCAVTVRVDGVPLAVPPLDAQSQECASNCPPTSLLYFRSLSLLLILYCYPLGLSLAFPTGPSLHSPLLSCSLPCCLWSCCSVYLCRAGILFYLLGPLWQGSQGMMNKYTRNAQGWNVSTKKAPPAANMPQSSSMGKQFASGFPKADLRKG